MKIPTEGPLRRDTIMIFLLSKLTCYGLQNNALQLLKSYHSDRSQIDNVKSNPHTVSCGIPQGSVMGPLLFTFS